jgi:hypothetical protein
MSGGLFVNTNSSGSAAVTSSGLQGQNEKHENEFDERAALLGAAERRLDEETVLSKASKTEDKDALRYALLLCSKASKAEDKDCSNARLQ